MSENMGNPVLDEFEINGEELERINEMPEEQAYVGLVSVIMPVYNIEKYLAWSIQSVLNQSYPYFELILVDDGSVDSSASICDEFAEKDPRIKVIHQENKGVSVARNRGIEEAIAKY